MAANDSVELGKPATSSGKLARLPWRWTIVACLIVGLLAAGASRLKFDNSNDAYFLKHDLTLERYKEFQRLFGSDEYTLITFDVPSPVHLAFIEDIRSLESVLAKMKHVRRVRSLASVRSIEGNDDALNVRGYLDGVKEDQIDSKLKQATVHPHYGDLYISKDGRHMGIAVESEILDGEITYKIDLRNQIKAAVAASPLANNAPAIVGAPMLDADVRDIVQRESSIFGALSFLVIGVGFCLAFRSWVAMAIPLLIAVLSIVASLGIMGWLKFPVTLLTAIVPSFLISVGVGSSVFLLTDYFQRRVRSQNTGAEVVQDSIRHVRFPCTLAVLTTSGALLAFCGSDIAPVMQVGFTLACGLLIALMLTFTLGALLLQFFAPKVSPKQSSRISRDFKWLSHLDAFTTRHQNSVVGGALAVTLLAAVGMMWLKFDFHYLGNFKERTSIRQDYRVSDARLPRSAAIEIVLTGTKPDFFTEPDILERIAKVQAAINSFPGLPTKSYSVADVVKEINQALHNNESGAYRIPSTSAEVSQALLLFESSGNDEVSKLVSPDYRVARISVLLPNVPDLQSLPLRQLIDSQMKETWRGTDVQYSLTGLVPMWLQINNYLRSTQIVSLLLALVVTTIVFIIYARSLVVGLVLSFANVSVMVIVLGIMALLGLPLDPYTVLIADIAIGVLDDDTMHFFADIRQRLKDGVSLSTAVSMARGFTGHAMFYYALSLTFGFLVYLFSSVQSLSNFGLLVAIVIAVGVVWEWFVMPSYLAVLHRYRIFS